MAREKCWQPVTRGGRLVQQGTLPNGKPRLERHCGHNASWRYHCYRCCRTYCGRHGKAAKACRDAGHERQAASRYARRLKNLLPAGGGAE